MNIQEFIKAKIKEFDKQFIVHCSDGDILGTDKSNEVRKAKHFISQSLLEYNEKIKEKIEELLVPDEITSESNPRWVYNKAKKDIINIINNTPSL